MALVDYIFECEEVADEDNLPETGTEGLFYAVNSNLEGEFVPVADMDIYIWEDAQYKFIGHRPPRPPAH